MVTSFMGPADLLGADWQPGGVSSVLIDGGFRRGTDIFKALALGADAISVGPGVWPHSARKASRPLSG